jgi:VIT1/CCC1 family predicted Fe2+/Mn2+ transporter
LTAITESLEKVAVSSAKDELTDYTVYKRLAGSKRQKNPAMREILSRLAETEHAHFQFWSKYSAGEDHDLKVSRRRIYYVLFLRLIFGISFAVRYLENHERSVIRKYKSIAHLAPPEDRPTLERIISDEEEHENQWTNQITEGTVKYISFIVLGLADAIVEISGIHAGSLGIYNSTELTGLAGVIAGAAASLAMASAAFAQAKQGFQGSPRLSAFYTGISYFIAALILATPYFLTRTMAVAIGTSLVLGVLIIAFISYYNSIISDARLRRNFLELTGIMFGASLVLFIAGLLVRGLLHITI